MYADLQVNGYVGVDFNDPTTSVEEVVKAAVAMREHGVVCALPTVITAGVDAMCQCIGTIVAAIEQDEVSASVFRGIHIEGPFLSPVEGFIGAHPVEHALAVDMRVMEKLWTVAGERTRIVTLAPEVDRDGTLTKFCTDRGALVAAGHTDAGLTDFQRCIEFGLKLFTHLGNGCPRLMDRHDNIIYRALSLREHLHFSLIADSFHVPQLLFRHVLDLVPLEKLLVVSDAISAAGLGPGEYQLGSRSVKIGEDKACRDASGEHFVGAASTMADANRWLANSLGLTEKERCTLLYENPVSLIRA